MHIACMRSERRSVHPVRNISFQRQNSWPKLTFPPCLGTQFPKAQGQNPMPDSRPPCHGPRGPGDSSLEELDLDATEYGFLTAARFFFVSFAEPNSSVWLSTIISSNCFFYGPNHAEAMRRAVKMVHEMRISRRSMLRFSNPRCQGCSRVITEPERHMMQLLKHARRGQNSRMASSAMLLCEGNPIEGLMQATRELCEMLPAPADLPIQKPAGVPS